MGTDIHIWAEQKTPEGYRVVDADFRGGRAPFDWRQYGMFGFLAGVRNYSAVPPLSKPRGVPIDMNPQAKSDYDDWGMDTHSASWLSVDELSSFDYDQSMEDRRVMRNNDGGCTCEPGEGEGMTYREFLGDSFMNDLEELRASGADRIVFWFDC